MQVDSWKPFSKRGSLFAMATSAFERRSARHFSHSARRMRAGSACSACSSSQLSLPHAACPPCQLPGTDVGCPCKNACVDAQSFPCRNSSCTSRSHSSCVRSHVTSSATPWMPFFGPPQINCWPYAARGSFVLTPLLRSICAGIAPRKVPRGGASCHKSPERTTFKRSSCPAPCGVLLPRGISDEFPAAELQARQQLCADHTQLVQQQPSPLRCCGGQFC